MKGMRTFRQAELAASVVTIGAVISGCTQPELTRRYAQMRPDRQIKTDSGLVEISAFVTGVPPGSGRHGIAYLDGRAQAELIKALDRQSTTPRQLLQLLATAFTPAPRPQPEIDRTIYSRRLILSLTTQDATVDGSLERLHPADRLEQVTIRLEMQTEGAEFRSWNRFATQYETVDLGSIKLVQGEDLGAGVSAAPASVPITASLDYEIGRTLTEELSLRQRYVVLSGALAPGVATLYQEGVTGINLVGNTAIDFTIKAPESRIETFRFGPLSKDGVPVQPDDVAFDVVPLFIPEVPDGIKVNISGTYRLRRVCAHGRTVVEGDDHIEYWYGQLKPLAGTIALVHPDEVRIDRRRLSWQIAHGKDESRRTLKLDGVGVLEFATNTEAQALLSWIKHSPNQHLSIGGKSLVLAALCDALLTAEEVPKLYARVMTR